MQSDNKTQGNKAPTLQMAAQGSMHAQAKGTEAQLLWMDLEILGMLLKIKLQALAREGDTCGMTAQIMDCVRVWCKEQEDIGR